MIARYKKGSRLAGLVYMHRISDRRFSGIAGRNFRIFRQLCGEASLKNVILVTNMWGEVSTEVGEARERELASNFLKPVLDGGAQMARNYNTEESAHEVIRRIMNNHPLVFQIQRELVDEHKDISNTAAGEAINAELNEAKRRHEAEMKKVQEEKERMMKQQEEEARRRREEEARRQEEELRRVREEQERVAAQRRQEMERAEMEAQRLAEKARIERERAEEEHRRQVVSINDRIAAEAAAAAATLAEMQRQMNQMHQQISRDSGGCIIM